jgi:6-phosphofructokinase 1
MTERPRVGVVFSGGPAPAANAVISAAATAFRRAGWDFVGFLSGYSALQAYDPETRPLVEGEDYRIFEDRDLWGLRHRRGVCIGTSRAGPGSTIRRPEDLDDPECTAPLQRVYEALRALKIEALVSIGGDGTLRTAYLLHRFQNALPADAPRVRVVHLPKTIDNDYRGIDFTFGFFTAVDVLAKQVLNLRADAVATDRYYIVECMGRRAGWLAYGVAVAGEAHMVVGVEDVRGALRQVVEVDGTPREFLDVEALIARITELVVTREAKGKKYGTVVLAEGLAELLPPSHRESVQPDAYGHVPLGDQGIGRLVAEGVSSLYAERTGGKKRVVGVQLGYEARCATPHAFDVMLGCQLGAGAYQSVVEQGHDGKMVSVSGQLELRYVAFDELIDARTLQADVRYVPHGSDFHSLAHQLGTRL